MFFGVYRKMLRVLEWKGFGARCLYIRFVSVGGGSWVFVRWACIGVVLKNVGKVVDRVRI